MLISTLRTMLQCLGITVYNDNSGLAWASIPVADGRFHHRYIGRGTVLPISYQLYVLYLIHRNH